MKKTPTFLGTRLERFIRKLQEEATGDLNYFCVGSMQFSGEDETSTH